VPGSAGACAPAAAVSVPAMGASIADRQSAAAAPSRAAGREPFLAPVVGLCAAVPVIASTLRALRDGWIPAGDQANIATRAHDVFTSRTPLVGLHSDVSFLTHHTVYSLGPMLFWLLAIPARVASPGSLTFTMGLLNTASIVGVVVLARRRGGRTLMFMTAIAVLLMSRSLAPELLHDVWNPAAGLFPFTLLIFLCWSLGCGEIRLLPLTVLVASFVVQCQLAFLPPSLGVLAIGLAGLLVAMWSTRGERGARGRAWPWVLAAVLVAVICWTPPAIDQIKGSPGNLTAIARTVEANHSTLGAAVGWHAVVLAVGVRPWWLRDPAYPFGRKLEVRANPSRLATLTTLLALAALLIVAAIGFLRRRADLWVGALIALSLCAALAAVAASTPTMRLLAATLGYTLWFGSPAGMFIWLLLAWAPLSILAGRMRIRPRRVSPVLASGVALGAVALAAGAVAAAERPDEHVNEYRPLGVMLSSLNRAVASSRTVQLTGNLGIATFRFKMAARYSLLEHGVRAVSPGNDTRVGSWYDRDHVRYDCTVYISDGTAPPSRSAVLVSRVVYAASYPVSAWVEPAGCPARHLAASAAGYATTWVPYATLLHAARTRPLTRAIINPARSDVEIKFREGLEWHAVYPAGAQSTLQAVFRERRVRVLFAPAAHRAAAKPASTHPLRLAAAIAACLLALLAIWALLRRRRRRHAPAGP